MTYFNLTLGVPSTVRLNGLAGLKYTTAPKSNEFTATVNGKPSPAWTTEGRGSHYIYFKDGEQLYYVKVAGVTEQTAARQAMTVTTDSWEETQPKAPVMPKRRRVAKV
jgi:hypothetical protein